MDWQDILYNDAPEFEIKIELIITIKYDTGVQNGMLFKINWKCILMCDKECIFSATYPI